jgi:hypothetical protein
MPRTTGSAGASASASTASSRRLRVAAAVEARLQPVAQGHQGVDLGDDAVLFGEGREG